MPYRVPALTLLSVLLLTILAACAPQQPPADVSVRVSGGAGADISHLAMAPLEQMSAEVQKAPEIVQEAYRFAVANPEVLQQIPCYCGCGSMGHTSNYDCYVASVAGDTITFDQHALGCGVCVDITQDAMRLTEQGQSPQEIKAFVDQTYAERGISNMDS